MLRDKQSIVITGEMASQGYSYQFCTLPSKTCNASNLPKAGKVEYSVSCDSCNYSHVKKWRGYCTSSQAPCNDISAVCKTKNDPSGAAACPQGQKPLLDLFSFQTPNVYQYGELVPPDDEIICYKCGGTCLRLRTCRGPVDLKGSMQLGTAEAWTIKDGKPNESTDLKLVTYATSKETIFNAKAEVNYTFDLTRPMEDTILTSLALWTSGLREQTSPTTKEVNGGPGTIDKAYPTLSERIRDANLVLGTTYYVYDNFFRPQYVGGTFYGVKNPLSSTDVLAYIHEVADKVMGQFEPQFAKDPTDAKTLKNLLLTFVRPPEPSQRVDQTPILKLHITFEQLKTLISDESQVNAFISNFLRDQQSTVTRQGGDPTKGQDPQLKFTGMADVRAQMVVLDSANYRLGQAIPVTATGELAPPSGYNIDHMVAAHYTITCTIEKWSIMLAAYFQEASYTAPDFTAGTCNGMQLQIPIIARACFEDANPDTQNEMLKASCPVKFQAPSAVSGEEYWLLYADGVDPYSGGKVCSCFNANLGNPQDADKPDAKATSRCFSVDCTEDERQELGLNDAVCAAPDKCELAELWVASKDPAERGRDLDSFDWVRFSLLCGKTIQPLAEQYYSWQMALAIGASFIAISIAIAVLLDMLLRPKLPKADYWSIVVSLMVLSILLGVGSGWVFAGEPFCDGKKSICRSRLLKTPLLQDSCPYQAQCECQFDQDCGGSCACTAGFCVSESGARDTERVDQTKVRPEILVPIAAVAIAAALICGFVSVPKLGKGGAAGVGIAVGLVLLGVAFGVGIYQEKGVLVFSKEPNCGNNLPATVTVLDVQRQVTVTFPTRSTWTPTGFPSGGVGLQQQDPYLVPAELVPIVEAEVQKVYPDFDAASATRGMMFLSNNDDDPSPREFFVFELPVTQKGNTMAVSRIQNTNNSEVDLWTVAWGKTAFHLDVINALPYSVTVTASVSDVRDGKLYSQTTLSGEPPSKSSQPIQTIGPQCLTEKDDADFFEKAKAELGGQWDGQTYESAFKTLQLDDKEPWFYYMQVSNTLALACNYDHDFTCTVGNPDKDLSGFPCREGT